MTELNIELKENRAEFEPGAEISGSVSWSLEQPAQALELRLFWFTRGKGTEDAGVVSSQRLEQPLPHETRSFRFQLPTAPYSFSGNLISLVWALELIAYPSKEVTRREIIMAPGGAEVRLEGVPSSEARRGGFSITIR
jgi:hypothetical protein